MPIPSSTTTTGRWRLRHAFWLGLVMIFCRATALWAGVTDLPITQDTRIDSRYNTDNYDGSSLKIIKNSVTTGDGSMVRGLLALPQLPALSAADVYSAKIWFCDTWYYGPPNENPYTRGVTLYPLTQGFSATTVTWQNSGGGQYDVSQPVAWGPAANLQSQVNGYWWCNWNFTSLWNNANLRNNGAELILSPETPPSTNWVTEVFENSGYSQAQYRPFVEVVTMDKWNDTNGNWTTAANWADGSVPNVVDAVAGFLGNATQDRTVTVAAPVTVSTLLFDNSAHKYTLAGNNTLAINDLSGNEGAIIVNDGSHAISAPLELDSNTMVTVANVGDTLSISGAIAGPSSGADTTLSKAGSGTLVLSGENFYTGGTIVSGGMLEIASADALPADCDLVIGSAIGVVFADGSTPAAQSSGVSAAAGSSEPGLSSTSPVPEPGTLGLLAAAAATLGVLLRSRFSHSVL